MVQINNVISYKFNVSCGVLKGGHLFPLLFLIFINDVSTILNHRKFLLFTDNLHFILIRKFSRCRKSSSTRFREVIPIVLIKQLRQ